MTRSILTDNAIWMTKREGYWVGTSRFRIDFQPGWGRVCLFLINMGHGRRCDPPITVQMMFPSPSPTARQGRTPCWSLLYCFRPLWLAPRRNVQTVQPLLPGNFFALPYRTLLSVHVASCTVQYSVYRWKIFCSRQCRSRIHERTISLRFLGIILRVLRLDVSVCIS